MQAPLTSLEEHRWRASLNLCATAFLCSRPPPSFSLLANNHSFVDICGPFWERVESPGNNCLISDVEKIRLVEAMCRDCSAFWPGHREFQCADSVTSLCRKQPYSLPTLPLNMGFPCQSQRPSMFSAVCGQMDSGKARRRVGEESGCRDERK